MVETLSKFGSRKFLVTMTVVVATVVLAWQGKVDANVALVLAACVAAYNAANVMWKPK